MYGGGVSQTKGLIARKTIGTSILPRAFFKGSAVTNVEKCSYSKLKQQQKQTNPFRVWMVEGLETLLLTWVRSGRRLRTVLGSCTDGRSRDF